MGWQGRAPAAALAWPHPWVGVRAAVAACPLLSFCAPPPNPLPYAVLSPLVTPAPPLTPNYPCSGTSKLHPCCNLGHRSWPKPSPIAVGAEARVGGGWSGARVKLLEGHLKFRVVLDSGNDGYSSVIQKGMKAKTWRFLRGVESKKGCKMGDRYCLGGILIAPIFLLETKPFASPAVSWLSRIPPWQRFLGVFFSLQKYLFLEI